MRKETIPVHDCGEDGSRMMQDSTRRHREAWTDSGVSFLQNPHSDSAIPDFGCLPYDQITEARAL